MSAVTNVIYIPETPFGPGNDWTLIVVAPPVGSAQVSFDGGLTYITSSAYNFTYSGFELRCQDGFGTQWGNGQCMPINGTGYGVIRARKTGESDYKLFTLGNREQNVGGDGFAFAYSAYCVGTDIVVTFAVQYADETNNYQLEQDDTQKIVLIVDGNPVDPVDEYVDGCYVDTCHWTRVFETLTIPVANFPITVLMEDSTEVVDPWSAEVPVGAIGNPCSSNVPTPTPVPTPLPTPISVEAQAVSDTFQAKTNVALSFNVSTNDTPCSEGTQIFAILFPPLNGVASFSTQTGQGVYTSSPGFVGSDSMIYGIFCNGKLKSYTRAVFVVSSEDTCYGQNRCAVWEETAITDCVNGQQLTRYQNINPCAQIENQFEWRNSGKCKKKVPCGYPDNPC